MRLWPSFKPKTKAYDTRTLIIDQAMDDFVACSLLDEFISPQKAFKFYRQNSSVATAVDIIADSFEQIQPVIELPDRSIVTNHPVLDLLRSPNTTQAWSDFAARISRHYLLTNQTHFYGLGAQTIKPSEIQPVKPVNVTLSTDSNQQISKFYVGAGVGRGTYSAEIARDKITRYYDGPIKELYRISGFSSMAGDTIPDSPLQAAALETNQQIKGRVHNLKVLENGGRLSLLIVFKEEHLSDDEHKQRTQRINETLGGPKNAGKIGVMSGGDVQEVKEMGNSNKDMDYAQLDNIAKQAIYFRYKIPIPLISTDASTFNNMQTAIEMLYDMAVLPLADKLFSGLSRFLLPRFGIPLKDARITYNTESLRPLRARRLNELKTRKEIGVETPNEMREGLPNREPLPGGNVIYQNATLVPMGVDIGQPDPTKN
jgi:HK97 family phage portal protein